MDEEDAQFIYCIVYILKQLGRKYYFSVRTASCGLEQTYILVERNITQLGNMLTSILTSWP